MDRFGRHQGPGGRRGQDEIGDGGARRRLLGHVPGHLAGLPPAPARQWPAVVVTVGPVGRRLAVTEDPEVLHGAGLTGRVRGTRRLQLRAFRASISLGTTLCTSPTIPRSATEKMGASRSLFTATMFFDPFIPTRCWVAPEIPRAM